MYAASNPYQDQSVTTASPARLVDMLYDRALLAIDRVTQLGDPRAPGNLETANHELQRAQDIVTELQVTLDHDRGGQIADNLHSLYGWCLELLITANVHKDLTVLAEVRDILAGLQESFAAAAATAAVEMASA